jgi:predicted DNA-binding transcriptional regulator YafY
MIFKQLYRIQQIDQLIRQKRTGSADELANKLKISRRQVYNWLEELKDIGLEIKYNRTIKSFVYLKSYKVDITFDVKELTNDELKNIKAGGFLLQICFCAKKMHKHGIFLKNQTTHNISGLLV